MELNEIQHVVAELVGRIKELPDAVIDYDENLTGPVFHFSPLDFMYLYCELKKSLRIEFDAPDLEDYGFNSIRAISDRISHKAFNKE